MTESARQPRPRGPKPRFTREEIAAKAIELLEREGRDALNLRMLGRELGVTPMAIYRYFADKDELLDAVVATVLEPVLAADAADTPWADRLEATAHALHHALQAAPAVAEVAALRRPGPALDPLREHLFAITADAGLDEHAAADVLRAVTSYVFGFTLVTRDEGRRRDSFAFGLDLLMTSVRGLGR